MRKDLFYAMCGMANKQQKKIQVYGFVEIIDHRNILRLTSPDTKSKIQIIFKGEAININEIITSVDGVLKTGFNHVCTIINIG